MKAIKYQTMQLITYEQLANETRTKKWTIEELQEIKTKYKKTNQ